MLRLITFGGLSICKVGAPTEYERTAGDLLSSAPRQLQRRSQALLAVLATTRVGEKSRDSLAALLWPEGRTEQARTALRQTLFRTKRDLDVEDIVLGTTDLRLNPTAISSDVAEFIDAHQRGMLERVVTLYRGPFLEGFHLNDAPAFERWAEEERDRLATVARSALMELAREASSRGDAHVAAGWWGRLAALDPLDETVAIAYMEALAAAGNTAAALRHAQLHETLLQSELEVEPSAAARALVQRLRKASALVSTPSKSLPGAIPTQTRPDEPSSSGSFDVRSTPPRDSTVAITNDEAIDMASAATSSPAVTSEGAESEVQSAIERADHRRLPLRVLSGTVVVLVLLLGARLVARSTQAPVLDRTLVAVAPFDVLDPGLSLWREGMVDVLSRALDGAGPLRTLAPTRAIRAWQGRAADAEAGAALGRASGAGLVVVGSLLQAGPDSVRVTAELVDVRSGRQVAEVVRRDARTRMDRLTDMLAVGLLRELGEHEPLTSVERSGVAVRGTSLDALKAFLRGEQAFRHARWEEARIAYEQAVALDSASPLALRRLGMVASWERLLQDSIAASYLLRAGALNVGLPPRDSLLVAADSLAAAANTTSNAVVAWGLTRRLFGTLTEAVRRYPKDPEVWFALGEARYHFGLGPVVGVPEQATLAAFDSAIALDSTFAPAYQHAVELGFNLGGAELGLRYARAYLTLGPTEPSHRGVRLVHTLIDLQRRDPSAVARLLDTVSANELVSARTMLRRWPDESETALLLSRALASGRPSEYPLFSDTGFMRRRLAQELAFRGHLAEAYRVLGPRDVPIFAELAALGAVPRETARGVFARWLTTEHENSRLALGWWVGQRDTTSLRMFAAAAARRLRVSKSGDEHAAAVYDTSAAAAHLALARGDSASALERFMTLPDTLCQSCYVHRLTRGRLLRARGRLREAMASLDEPLAAFVSPMEVEFALERARVAKQLGDRARSAHDYHFVAQAWAHGDSILLHDVEEAREVLTQR